MSVELAVVASPMMSVFPVDVQPVRRVRILLVEDEKFLREVIRRVLLDEGYEVLASKDACEALRKFGSVDGNIDLLVTDLILPGRNGARLAAELKKKQAALKVVVTSGYPERIAKECQCGASPDLFFLPKPFTTEILTQKIHEALNNEF